MTDVPRETHVGKSRAAYYRWWRVWTSSDWRGSNARSRERHREQRRAHDRAMYQRRRMLQLMERQQRVEAWLERIGLGDSSADQ